MDELVMEVKDIIKCVPYPHTLSHLVNSYVHLHLLLLLMMMHDAVLFLARRAVFRRVVMSCAVMTRTDLMLCCLGSAVCRSALRLRDVIIFSCVRRYKGNIASSQFTIQFAIFHCCRVVYDVLAIRWRAR